MRIWTFTTIDWDLMRDERGDGADTILPVLAYRSREAAEKAVGEAILEAQEYLGLEDFERFDVNMDEIEWTDDHSGEFHRWTTDFEVVGLKVYLYDMELAD